MTQVLILPVSGFSIPSEAAPTSLGPTSPEEAQFLWKESQTALRELRYQDAVTLLQRYVDRYAGEPNTLKAHALLGKALLEIGEPKKAISVLRDFLGSSQNLVDSLEATIDLGRSYLTQNLFTEAYLASLEMSRFSAHLKSSSDSQMEILLIRSQALLGLKHQARAQNALESAEKRIINKTSPAITGRIFDLKLQIKLQHCETLPGIGPLDEAQLRDQLERRGTCLLEALLIFQKVLKTGDLKYSGAAAAQMNEAYNNYARECTHPKSRKEGGKPRTLKESVQYQVELASVLTRDLKFKSTHALELIDSWKTELPDSLHGSFIQVAKNLERWK